MAAANDDLKPGDKPSAIEGIGPSYEETLVEAGYKTVGHVQRASVEELAEHIPMHVVRDVKDRVGSDVGPVTSIADAKSRAQQTPGAVAKVVRGPDGKQNAKVLHKESEQHLDGATVEIHKG